MNYRSVFFADLTHTGTITNADTFPLGVGFVAAYLKSKFSKQIDVEVFKLPSELNDRLILEQPRVLCLSNYIWNSNLSFAFSKYVKKISPQTIVIMGGPNFPLKKSDRVDFFLKNSSVDFYIRWEGEQACSSLYKTLLEYNFKVEEIIDERIEIENTSYLSAIGLVEGNCERIQDLSTIPSPYTTGLFDKFFAQGLRPLIETQRGCPFLCTFCNESNEFKNKVKHRSIDYLKEELTYIVRHLVVPVDLTSGDNNFGMYKIDEEKAKVIRSIVDKYNWPKHIDCSLGKNNPERVLKCVKIINGKSKGILKFGSSLQSSSNEVLKAIQRKNLPVDTLAPLVKKKYLDEINNTKYFTELILGLPEDTKERHYESLRYAIDDVGMNIVNVHQLTLMQGTEMNSVEQKKKYGLKSRFRIFVGRIGIYEIGDEKVPIAEVENVVVSNSRMSLEDWAECRVMSLLVKIYVDQDYFEEIFGFIRHLELSCFSLLRLLKDEVISKDLKLMELINLFLKKTFEPLYETYDDVIQFVETEGTVEAHKRGEFGGNELLVQRAKGYMEYNNELHEALKEASLIYLDRNGKLDENNRAYIEEAISFSKNRKFDIERYEDTIVDVYHFDFIKALKSSFKVLPKSIKIAPTRFKFFLGNEARVEIEEAIEHWIGRGELNEKGNSSKNTDAESLSQREFNLGKLFHMGNLRVFCRSVEMLSAN
jgi:radical SAM superfamily enzyme YgiQ (UPF0313 family)